MQVRAFMAGNPGCHHTAAVQGGDTTDVREWAFCPDSKIWGSLKPEMNVRKMTGYMVTPDTKSILNSMDIPTGSATDTIDHEPHSEYV